MKTLPKIAITLGDPAGIGSEITIKAISHPDIISLCRPVIIGSKRLLDKALRQFNPGLNQGNYDFIDAFDDSKIDFVEGKADIQCAHASVAYIKKAVQMALDKEVNAIVTAPITKESLKLADYKWHGHTEMLAEFTDTNDYAMMLCSERLKIMLVTIHEPISKVPHLLSQEAILQVIKLAHQAIRDFGITNPKIAVCGLNPHAGEGGLFGKEEFFHIIPAIREAQRIGINATGPYCPDTIFYKVINGTHDIVVCMYHDQGLIPLKTLDFDTGVNVTVGLPIIRTSPDHGTAYDIAYKGIANPNSMIAAIKTALILSSNIQ